MDGRIFSRLKSPRSSLSGIKRKLSHWNLQRQAARIPPPSAPLEHVIIGIGAQKSATTWLASTLAQHPDIHLRTKEVHYWDTVRAPYIRWDSIDSIVASSGRMPGSPFGKNPFDHSRYLPSLEFARSTERIVADITPAYALCTQETLSEMKAIHGDVRFIFLMRDPVSRLWSGLRHKMRASLKQGGSTDWLERMFLEACDNPHDPDFRRSRYDETLTALDGAGCNVCVMFYETLFTEESMRTLSEFVGVDQLAGHFETRKNVGVGADLRLSNLARAHGRKALADTYDFVADRFGDRVPTKWSK